jgi:hypothetical protein
MGRKASSKKPQESVNVSVAEGRGRRAVRPSARQREAVEESKTTTDNEADNKVEDEVEEKRVMPSRKKRAVVKAKAKPEPVKKEEVVVNEVAEEDEEIVVPAKRKRAPPKKAKANANTKAKAKKEEEQEEDDDDDDDEDADEKKSKKKTSKTATKTTTTTSKKAAPKKKKKKADDEDDEYDDEPQAVNVEDQDIEDDGDVDDDDDDDAEIVQAAAAASSTTTTTSSSKKRKEPSSGEVTDAVIKRIKQKNAQGRKAIPSNDARGLGKQFRHVHGNNLGPTAKALGIPYERALVGFNKVGWRYFPDFSGIIIWKEDYEDLQAGLKYRDRKKTAERERERERSEKIAAEAKAQRERQLERSNSLAGVYTSAEFVAALEAAQIFDGTLLAAAVKRVVGKAASDMAGGGDAAAAATVEAGIRAVCERQASLLELLGRVDVTALDEAQLQDEAREPLLAALDGSGDMQAVVAPLAAMFARAHADSATWRTKLAAVCTRVAHVPSCAAAVIGGGAKESAAAAAKLRALLTADENGAFDFDAERDYVSIAGSAAEPVGVARRLDTFDRVLRERGVDGDLSPWLRKERAIIEGGVKRRGDDLRAQLADKTLAELRGAARERGAGLRGATRKEDIIEAIIAHVCESADAELDALLGGDKVAAEVAGHAHIRAFLQQRTEAAWHREAVRLWHSRQTTAADAVVALLSQKRTAQFDALGKREAVVRSWDLKTTTSTIVADARKHLASEAAIQASTEPVATVVATTGKRVADELVAWIAQHEADVAVHKQRKAALELQLAGVGYRRDTPPFELLTVDGRVTELDTSSANTAAGVVGVSITASVHYLVNGRLTTQQQGAGKIKAGDWHKLRGDAGVVWQAMTSLDRDRLPLLWPPRLQQTDYDVLGGVVVDLRAKVRVPTGLLVRAARRATLLDALKRAGVATARIPLSATSAQPLLHKFLGGTSWLTPRAKAAALVGHVAAAAQRDIFAALPLHVIYEICAVLQKGASHATDDLINLIAASNAFALGAAVWACDHGKTTLTTHRRY